MEEVVGWKVNREMERWEKKQIEELKVKQVDKLMQTVQLVPVKVSRVSVQTDKVVPAVLVIVKGTTRASYASMVTQVSVEVAASAPVDSILPPIGARPLVVDRRGAIPAVCDGHLVKGAENDARD